jgi:hypothetical protein
LSDTFPVSSDGHQLKAPLPDRPKEVQLFRLDRHGIGIQGVLPDPIPVQNALVEDIPDRLVPRKMRR